MTGLMKKTTSVLLSLLLLCSVFIFPVSVGAAGISTPELSTLSNVAKGVKITWKKASGAEGYYVLRKTASQDSWKKIATVKGKSSVSYTDTNVKSGSKYSYTIKAFNGKTVSKFDKTGKSKLFLSAPAVKASSITAVSAKLSWSKVKGASGYAVFRKAPGESSFKKIATVSGKLKYKATSLKAKTSYSFAIKALKGKTYSALSTPVSVSTKSKLTKIKIGLITVHDQNSVSDCNIINDFNKISYDDMNVTCYHIANVPESSECFDAAEVLVDLGCSIVFANAFGHEDYLIRAAKKYPKIHFVSISGTKAHTEKLKNFHNAYGAIHEGKYLCGVAAGMKLNEMIKSGEITAKEAKLGYVGAFQYAEVVSAYSAFFLGARSVCKSVSMDVTFTGSWYDESAEKEAANSLISNGCVLLSQHSDSPGAPVACEEAGIPNIAYNDDFSSLCPNTSLLSMKINWQPFFKKAVKLLRNRETIPYDYTGTLKDGSVKLLKLNKSVASASTSKKLQKVADGIKSGDIRVFDTSTFTVNGAKLKKYRADVDTDPEYTPDTNVIVDGRFAECEFRSAPYFDVQIDGINLLNSVF